MAAMARGSLIKLYELANLSNCKGETFHQHSLECLPLQQGSPREDSPKGVHVRLHPDESLANGDEADESSPFSTKAASTTSSTLDGLQLDIALRNHK